VSESTFPDAIIIAELIGDTPVRVDELASTALLKGLSLDNLISGLELLYAIGLIVFDHETEEVTYAR
jgi:hypothetical protein